MNKDIKINRKSFEEGQLNHFKVCSQGSSLEVEYIAWQNEHGNRESTVILRNNDPNDLFRNNEEKIIRRINRHNESYDRRSQQSVE